jgi:PAS domain S-box-containing protein
MSDKEQDRKKTLADAADLRKRAEEQAGAAEPASLSAQTPEAIEQLIHELRVHQIELEMQNEELRTAQAEIEAGQARYFDLYDLAPVGYVTVSERNLILEANLTVATLLGVNRGALVKKPLTRYILKEDEDIYYLHRKKLFDTGEPQSCELRLVKPDGSTLWAWLDATTAEDPSGATVCLVVLSDITERKEAEKALQESEKRFRQIADNISDVVWISDNNLDVTYVSPSIERMLGESVEEHLKKNLEQKLTPQALEQLITVFQEEIEKENDPSADKNRTRILEMEHYKADGKTIWVASHVTGLRDDAGNLIGFQGVTRDITDRKQAEVEIRTLNEELEQRVAERTTQLEAVNKELQSFAYSISHDFRAPLRALDGFSASLQTKYDEHLDDEGRHYLDRIRNAAIYMSNLVDDLLDLSRITRSEFKQQQVDLSKLTSEIVVALQEAEPQR